MNFKVDNVVRGTGLVYFNVSADEELRNRRPTFKVKTDEGIVIPCITHDSAKFEVLADYIIVVPLLPFGSIEISCDYCENTQKFTSSQIKWMSRWSYKIKKETAAAMRDFEKRLWANNVRFHFKLVMDVSNKNQKLLKGYVNYPFTSEKPELNILDAHGMTVDDANVYIGDVGEIQQEGFERKEYPFTLRVSNEQEFCLYAESQDSAHSAVVFFDNSVMHSYLSQYPSPWDVCNSWDAYQQRVYAREFLFKTEAETEFSNQEGPKFSIVVPLYKTPIGYFNEMIESVQKQYYKNWELVLVNASPDDSNLANAIEYIDDKRVRVVEVAENEGISVNTNVGIEGSTGDFIGFLDHDDTIDPRTLSLMAERINEKPETDVLYTDQDLINLEGNYVGPVYKPSFNLDYLRSMNYISHFLIVRADLLKSTMLKPELDGAQDFDLTLRLAELTSNFEHIDEVVYHRRQTESSTSLNPEPKVYAHMAGLNSIQQHLNRLGINGVVQETHYDYFYNPVYLVSGNPKVSIIIPNKNHVDVLKTCIDSILNITEYDNYEIIIVENGSDEQSIFDYYDEVVEKCEKVKVIGWQGEFNFSKVCNFGTQYSDGEFLLFLNNDTEVLDPRWLELMLGDCQREDVGVVGAKLIYPDDTIQHAGVYFQDKLRPGFVGGPSHLYFDLDKDELGYANRAFLKSDVEAVTGACLMTKRKTFDELEMFDESYNIDFSDIDYCFKVTDSGLKVLMDPFVVLRHCESVTLGQRICTYTPTFIADEDRLRTKWANKFIEGDKLSSCIMKLQ